MANRIDSNTIGRHEEAVAGEAGIYPGMQLKMNSSGEVIKHATEGGALGDERLIALEDALQGNLVSTVYTDDTTVFYLCAVPGDEVRLLVEAGTAIGIGDKLYPAGDGTVQEFSALSTGTLDVNPIAVAMEAVDLSASGAVDTLCRARIV